MKLKTKTVLAFEILRCSLEAFWANDTKYVALEWTSKCCILSLMERSGLFIRNMKYASIIW